MDKFAFAEALNMTEDFFWNYFTDNYIELVKNRIKNDEDPEGSLSAITTSRVILENLLKILSPFIPMVTDEVWGWIYSDKNFSSIHLENWPTEIEIDFMENDHQEFENAKEAIACVRKEKTALGISLGATINNLVIKVDKDKETKLKKIISDLKDASRCEVIKLVATTKDKIISATID